MHADASLKSTASADDSDLVPVSTEDKTQHTDHGVGPGMLLVLSFVVSLALIAALGLGARARLISAQQLESSFIPAERLAGEIAYYDELLTQSARLAAGTGEPRWETRYVAAVDELDRSIDEIRALSNSGAFSLEGLNRVEDSNRFLVQAETRALDLARQGRTDEASEILWSAQYESNKASYASGLEDLREDMRAGIAAGIASERSDAGLALRLCALALALSTGIFAWTWRAFRRWQRRVESLESQRQLAAVELADTRMRTLTESSSDVAMVIDSDMNLSFVSSAANQVLQRSAGTLIGESIWTLVHPEDHVELDELLAQAALASGASVRAQIRMLRAGEACRVMEVSARDRTQDHRIGGLILNAHDVTDLVDAQRQAQELLSAEVLQTQHLRHQADHDPLTGLLNRPAFQRHLAQALADGQGKVCVLMIDIDGFKDVNDARGHQAGDRLLIQVAERISSALRKPDLLARIGGDEFAIMLRPPEDMSIEHFAERMLLAIGAPINDETGVVQLTASIGVAGPDFDAPDTESVMTDADLAMYQAKRSGGGQYIQYRSQMRVDFIARIVLKEELEQALIEDQFVVHYQPVWNLRTGLVDSVEALVRWQHPSRGLLAPGHFLPMAEELGLIGEIDTVVLRKACMQLGRWRHSGDPALTDIQLGVNVSALDLSRVGLFELVSKELAANNLPPSALVVEITETAMMDNVEVAKSCLGELTDMGVKLAIDDFGTGYSSLSQLQTLDFDILKIDRAFVGADDAAAQSLLETIVALAQILDLQIVAEGIETTEQLNKMQNLGSQFGQGFLMAKPMPPADVADLAYATYMGSIEVFKARAAA